VGFWRFGGQAANNHKVALNLSGRGREKHKERTLKNYWNTSPRYALGAGIGKIGGGSLRLLAKGPKGRVLKVETRQSTREENLEIPGVYSFDNRGERKK